MAVTAKSIIWDHNYVNIKLWNPGPLTMGGLADSVRNLLARHAAGSLPVLSDDVVRDYLAGMYAHAYDGLNNDALYAPYAATPVALLRDIVKTECYVKITSEPHQTSAQDYAEGKLLVVTDGSTVPSDESDWGHEWNFPLYFCAPTLILPTAAMPLLDKPSTPGKGMVATLHHARASHDV